MLKKNLVFLDFSLDNCFFLILKNKKTFKKNLKNISKTENIPIIFFEFIKKNKIEINNNLEIFVNIGPGNLIAIRNSIVLAKMIKIIFNCKLYAFSNFDLLSLKKNKQKVLISTKTQKILMDLKRKMAKKIIKDDLKKFQKFKINVQYSNKDIENLIYLKKFNKKIVPISCTTM